MIMDNTFDSIIDKIIKIDLIIVVNLALVFVICFFYKIVFGKDE